MRRSTIVGVIALAVTALVACAPDSGTSDGDATPAATEGAAQTGVQGSEEQDGEETGPIRVAAPGEGFDFCGLIDVDDATQVAEDVGVAEQLDIQGEPLRVSSRRVSTAWNTRDEVVTEVTEICRYGPALNEVPFDLQVYPEGRRDDWEVPERAEPREDLGEDAYLLEDQGWFNLGAPAAGADAYFSLTGMFHSSTDAEAAEDGLTRLLEPVLDQVPPNAAIAGLEAGDDCADFEDPVTAAMEGQPAFSRYTEIDGSFNCSFATLATGRIVMINHHRGQADARRSQIEARESTNVGPPRELDGLDDAWLLDGIIIAFRGDDAITVQLMGVSGRQSLDPDADFSVDEELAAAVVPLIAD